MAIDVAQLSVLIDTPEKARRVKSVMDKVNPSTLSPEDRAAYVMTQQAMKRWINPRPIAPGVDIYEVPRSEDDVISGIDTRAANEPASAYGDPSSSGRVTKGELGFAGLQGVADLGGVPLTREEFKQAGPAPMSGAGMVAGMVRGGREAYKQGREIGGITGLIRSASPFIAPMMPAAQQMGSDIVTPILRSIRGEAPSKEESIAAARSGSSAIAGLALTPKSVRRANVPANIVLDPARTIRKSTAAAEKAVGKNVGKVRRGYETEFVENARDIATKAETELAELRQTVTGPPTQETAHAAMAQADTAIKTSKSAKSMAKREYLYNKSIPDEITRRLAPFIDDIDVRLNRGDDIGAETLRTYRKDGIPRNPDVVKADKAAQHEATQSRLAEPDMQSLRAPEDVVISAVADDAMGKAASPVLDSMSANPELKAIIRRWKSVGRLSLEDYKTLRDMETGNYVLDVDASGNPITGKVQMPSILSDTIGYVERLRSDFGGRLPSTPAEINQAKADRYNEVSERTFSKEITEADKSMASVHRGQASGLRQLVDQITSGPDNRSPITEMNRRYAVLAALEDGLRNYNTAGRIENPLPPIAMMSGTSTSTSGVVRGATGTGTMAFLTRPLRHLIRSPEAGRRVALARETLARARGINPPPEKAPAVGPGMSTTPPAPLPGGRAAKPSTPQMRQATPSVSKPTVTADLQALGKEAFTYARNGQLKKLEALWSEHGKELRKTMRKSDVAWVEEKLARRAKNVKQEPTKKKTPKEEHAEIVEKRNKISEEYAERSVNERNANLILKDEAARRKAKTTSEKPVAGPPVMTNPLEGTPVRGDWRVVKTADEATVKAEPAPPPEKPSGQVSADQVSFDHMTASELHRKIDEFATVLQNTKNPALRERVGGMRKEAERVLLARINGEPPTKKPAETIEVSDAVKQVLAEELEEPEIKAPPKRTVAPEETKKSASIQKRPAVEVTTPGPRPDKEPKATYQSSGGLQHFDEFEGIRKGSTVRTLAGQETVTNIIRYPNGKTYVTTKSGQHPIDSIKK